MALEIRFIRKGDTFSRDENVAHLDRAIGYMAIDVYQHSLK